MLSSRIDVSVSSFVCVRAVGSIIISHIGCHNGAFGVAQPFLRHRTIRLVSKCSCYCCAGGEKGFILNNGGTAVSGPEEDRAGGRYQQCEVGRFGTNPVHERAPLSTSTETERGVHASICLCHKNIVPHSHRTR